jgi:hypothetical protein
MSAQVLVLKPASQSKQDDVLVHVRYHPNADVATIGECPDHLTPQQWLGHLWRAVPGLYLGLSGGRGFFRIPRDTFEAIRAKA